jgi:t-SNARE complex subunit (syntaxin)
MHGTLVRKFLDLMQEYQAMLTKYDKKFRDKAYKEVQIGTHTAINIPHTHRAGIMFLCVCVVCVCVCVCVVCAVAPDASPEDIDEVLESGEEAIFQKHIMEDRKHAKAKQTLDYLKEKHNDLLALEKSITELNQVPTARTHHRTRAPPHTHI